MDTIPGSADCRPAWAKSCPPRVFVNKTSSEHGRDLHLGTAYHFFCNYHASPRKLTIFPRQPFTEKKFADPRN